MLLMEVDEGVDDDTRDEDVIPSGGVLADRVVVC